MEIIALSGYARAGKDEAAKVLVEEFGFTRVAFADKLREVLYALNPLLPPISLGQGTMARECYLQDFIEKFGWGGYKENDGWHGRQAAEVRRLLQRMGTEAGRETLDDNIWVDAALSNPVDKIVITDCRFINEASRVKEFKGQVWRINRPGVGPVTDHKSETELDNWAFDNVIGNDGDIHSLKKKVRNAYRYSIL